MKSVVESRWFNISITIVIVINAVTLGLETSPEAVAKIGYWLHIIDRGALWIFTIELAMKFHVYRGKFFKDGWNWFDLIIVTIAWIPASGPLSVLRAMRILRVLRLISVVPQMRVVVGALIGALPGMGSIVAVLGLVFYIASVMATKLFGELFPEWFGTVGESMYSLFQIMTLESWSMGIVRPVMELQPLAWIFFVPFVIVTSFAVLNLFIGIIVNSMNQIHADDRDAIESEAVIAHGEREVLMNEITELRTQITSLSDAIKHRR